MREWQSRSFAASTILLIGLLPGAAVGADPEFVGSDRCAACHKQTYDSWKQSYHSRMVLPRQEGLLKDAGDNWASDGKAAGPTKGNIDGKDYKMEDVVFVIGTKWKQRYLVTNPATGNHQFMDKQWNRFTKQWEPYIQKNDWETQCATCHTTGYRITAYDPNNTAAMKFSMAERNVGCEACHGPGIKHVTSLKKADIFNPRNATKSEASKACGYCHIRAENTNFRSAQNNPSEHLPHPQIGESYKAGQDDWTKWYADKALIPGVHAEDPLAAENKGTDLANAFWLDEQSTRSGLYDARKHHEEYQEFIQSKHSKTNLLACPDCHMPHAVTGKPMVEAKAACTQCHGSQFDWQKIMPGTGQTALQLFVRTHTFNPNQARAGGMTADGLPPPGFFYGAR
jgi:nitrate/TMAO reductase-like tetraheme cytochrome c subunit